MPVTLTPSIVEELTDVAVNQHAVDAAAAQIHNVTGYTVDEHVDTREVAAGSVQLAWSLVAVRIDQAMRREADLAVTGETQGDYSYAEDAGVAATSRFQGFVSGRPEELLEIVGARGMWAHI